MSFAEKRQPFLFIMILSVSLLEYAIVFHSHILAGSYTPLIPLNDEIRTSLTTFYPGIISSSFDAVLFPLAFLHLNIDTFVSRGVTFIVAVASMFYASVYFSDQVSENRSSNRIIAIPIAMLYPLHPFLGGGFYAVFDAFFPLFLVVAHRGLARSITASPKAFLRDSIFVAVVSAFVVSDFRSILYTLLFSLLLLVFVNLQKPGVKMLVRSLLFTFASMALFILLMLRYVLAIVSDLHVGVAALGSTLDLQFQFAYQSFPLIFSTAGAEQWYGIYEPSMVFLGLIPFLTIIIAVIVRPKSGTLGFFAILTVLVALFDTFGGNTVNRIIGQTSFSTYLPALFPTYLISVLYIPILFIGFATAASVIVHALMEKLPRISPYLKNRGKFAMKAASILIVLTLLGTQALYISHNVQADMNSTATQSSPESMIGASYYLYDHNVSGHVLVIGNFSGVYYQDSYLPPFTFSPQAGWGANWFWHPIQKMIHDNSGNLSSALSYLGVQYILYRNLSTNYTNYLLNQKDMSVVYSNNGTFVLNNLLYTPEIVSSRGPVVAFQFPQLIDSLASYNTTLPVVPFYELLNSPGSLNYMGGVIGENISGNEIKLLLLNSTNSYRINMGSLNINELPGWQQISDINIGDAFNAMAPSSNAPLTLKVNAPAGKYNIFIVGGSTPAPGVESNIESTQFSSNASLTLSSGNYSTTVRINQTQYSPFIGVYTVDNFSINGKSLTLEKAGNGTPFLSDIYMVPSNESATLNSEAAMFNLTHTIVSLAQKSVNTSLAGMISKLALPGGSNASGKPITTIVSFSHGYIASFGFTQAAEVSGQIFKWQYNFGAAYIYLSDKSNSSIMYNDYSGISFLYYNGISVAAVALLLYIVSRRRV